MALYDVIRLYGDRIVELHIRQSQNEIWTETFGEGDIDYQKLTNVLTERGIRPLVTIEQAVEEKSLNTMNSLEAHKISHAQARKTFAPFLK